MTLIITPFFPSDSKTPKQLLPKPQTTAKPDMPSTKSGKHKFQCFGLSSFFGNVAETAYSLLNHIKHRNPSTMALFIIVSK